MSDAFKTRLKNIQISPRKLRIVADLIRGKKVQLALDHLAMTNRKGARILEKVVNSAIASARQAGNVDVDNLKISEILVDQGIALKRFLPRAQGRATPIKKRMSHVVLKVSEKK